MGYNLYAYVSNNPIRNLDANGNFLKKVQKWLNNITKKVSNVVEKKLVAEVGVGVGYSRSKNISGYGYELGAYQDMSIGYKKGKVYNSNNYNASASINVKNTKIGLSNQLKHTYDNSDKISHGNPFATYWTVKDCVFSEDTWTSPVTYRNLTVEESTETIFYGISMDWHEGVGGHIVLGFEVEKTPVLWEQADNVINIAPSINYRGRY